MSTYNMNQDQLQDYVNRRLTNNGDAVDVYYNAKTDNWAAVATDGGCPVGYQYMGTYTCENGKVNYRPR